MLQQQARAEIREANRIQSKSGSAAACRRLCKARLASPLVTPASRQIVGGLRIKPHSQTLGWPKPSFLRCSARIAFISVNQRSSVVPLS
jgi:hypothetical protein